MVLSFLQLVTIMANVTARDNPSKMTATLADVQRESRPAQKSFAQKKVSVLVREYMYHKSNAGTLVAPPT